MLTGVDLANVRYTYCVVYYAKYWEIKLLSSFFKSNTALLTFIHIQRLCKVPQDSYNIILSSNVLFLPVKVSSGVCKLPCKAMRWTQVYLLLLVA